MNGSRCISLLVPVDLGDGALTAKGLRTLIIPRAREDDPELVDALHDAPVGRGGRPVTVAFLDSPDQTLAHVTALTRQAAERVLIALEDRPWLGGGNRIEHRDTWLAAAITDPHELVGRPSGTRTERIGVHFLSPTTFRVGDRARRNRHFNPLPEPSRVVESWLERMRAHAPDLVRDLVGNEVATFRDWVRQRVWLSGGGSLDVATSEIEGEPVLAVRGHIRLHVAEPEGPRRQLLRALARFALFCGTGYGSIHGLGQTVCGLGDEAELAAGESPPERLLALHRPLNPFRSPVSRAVGDGSLDHRRSATLGDLAHRGD